MSADILNAARAIAPQLVADRREIHRHPELAYEEVRTAEFVADRLRALGIEVQTGLAQTGVVGLIAGTRPGKTVLLRADMDALPIQEQGVLPFASENPGVMHACGHDGHTAMLLGAARLLTERRDSFNGNVKLMFQPAEEGGAGCLRMIEAGLLNNPKVDAAFALHVSADYLAGQVAIKAGPTHASADKFSIRVEGKGGHAARPHVTVDPVVIAVQITLALQTLVSREVNPVEPAVLTVASIEAGITFNVIPDFALLLGTVRTYSDAVQTQLERRISEVASGVAAAMRGSAQVTYERLYPPNVNHFGGAELVAAAARQTLGEGDVVDDAATMGGEDFAFLMQRLPGAMFRLGVRGRDWPEARPLHNSSFDLDESALPVGTAVLTSCALRFLAE